MADPKTENVVPPVVASPPQLPVALSAVDGRKVDVEERRLALEERKVVLEERKALDERRKVWIGGVSVGVPLIIAALTVVGSAVMAERTAHRAFEMKAAEIVMNTTRASATQERAAALRLLFPDQLAENFGATFNVDDFRDPADGSDEVLLKLLAEHPDQAEDIVARWAIAYPADRVWVGSLVDPVPVTTAQPTPPPIDKKVP